MTSSIYISFHWGNEYSFVWSYHSMDGNW